MATLAQQMVTDMATFADVDEFGELVTVTSPANVTYSNVPAVFQEYLGAQDEKTQGPFILPIASVPTIDRGWTITRTNGDVWTVTDVSQRDVAAVNCRAALPQLTT